MKPSSGRDFDGPVEVVGERADCDLRRLAGSGGKNLYRVCFQRRGRQDLRACTDTTIAVHLNDRRTRYRWGGVHYSNLHLRHGHLPLSEPLMKGKKVFLLGNKYRPRRIRSLHLRGQALHRHSDGREQRLPVRMRADGRSCRAHRGKLRQARHSL